MDGDYDDPGPITPWVPAKSLDSDDVRNGDGDVVVDAPTAGSRSSSIRASRSASQPEQYDAGYRDRLRPSRRHRGQIDGAPKDGDADYQKSTTESE